MHNNVYCVSKKGKQAADKLTAGNEIHLREG